MGYPKSSTLNTIISVSLNGRVFAFSKYNQLWTKISDAHKHADLEPSKVFLSLSLLHHSNRVGAQSSLIILVREDANS